MVPGAIPRQLGEHTLGHSDVPPRREAEWGKGLRVMQRRKAPQLFRPCRSTPRPRGSGNTWQDAVRTLRIGGKVYWSLQEEPAIAHRVKLWHREIPAP